MALDAAPLRSKIYCMKNVVAIWAGAVLLLFSAMPVRAQAPVAASAGPMLSPDQLDQLVGPIALYPDPLIAEILPAATFPSEIVMADRYVGQGGDPSQIAEQGWDPSVQAMAHYPNVLKWMDDNLTWTTQLGQAFQSQQADVMSAIQALRGKAQSLGNLPSTQQESVVTDDGDIEIDPTDPDQMYVPEYDPNAIYFQPGIFCTFPYWLPLGIWLGYDWDWHHHGLVSWGPGHPRPGNWWHQTPGQRHSYLSGHPPPPWHSGAGIAVAAMHGSWERGYEAPAITRSFAHPTAIPHGPAPSIGVVRPAPVERQTFAAPRVEAPREVFHSAPSAGFFGGGQTGREAVESSARGGASRGSAGGGGRPR